MKQHIVTIPEPIPAGGLFATDRETGVLVALPAFPEGEWWACTCGQSGTGFPSRAAAEEAAEFHELGALMDGAGRS